MAEKKEKRRKNSKYNRDVITTLKTGKNLEGGGKNFSGWPEYIPLNVSLEYPMAGYNNLELENLISVYCTRTNLNINVFILITLIFHVHHLVKSVFYS